jgi:hypothetical protein
MTTVPTHFAAGLRQLRFEHHRVRMLLAAHDFPDEERERYTAEAREVSRRQGDDGYLTFRALLSSDRFCSCPVRLQARSFSIDYIDRLGLPYFMNFERTLFYQKYLLGWSSREDGDARPFGLVLGLPRVRGGVKHGLATLKREELISARRGNRRTYIVVSDDGG